VPITIQALTGETLTQLNATTFDDYVKYLPNVTAATNGPGQGQIYMRGLATTEDGLQSSGATGSFPNVAVYIDEQSAQLPGRNLDIYAADIERIEVLEGPQGTLFGAGAQEQLRRYGEKFIADIQVYRTDKPHFIDKMPNNFRHIGLIHLILPNAKIIDAQREPMACCFSNFKQLFASGQEFTYSLEDIGRYYRAYVELMAHWDAVLPGKVLRVQHEQLVEDFEPSVRRILDFVGLGFEPACLEFYKTERNVRTASSEQVRQPIYREGLEQWRNFEPGPDL
jgi:hypothetical protein